jgi:hypothetical protein
MKKNLLTAFFVISCAIAPCLCSRIEISVPVSELAGTLVRPIGSTIFWHAWNFAIDHVLAAPLGGPAPGAQNSCPAMSISGYFVRRVDRSENLRPAGQLQGFARAKTENFQSNQEEES